MRRALWLKFLPVGTGSEGGGELGRAATVASLVAALTLLFCAVHAPPKNWLLDYYPNPNLEGDAAVRAWVRRANFEVPADTLLSRVPDRPDFSLRMQSCLPLSDATELAVRLTTEDRARFYVDGKLVVDSEELAAQQAQSRGKKKPKNEARKIHVELGPGVHLLTLEYRHTSGPGALRVQLSQPGELDKRLQSRMQRPTLDGRCDAT